MNRINGFLFILFFIAITPTLGFFSFPSFFILTLLLFFLLFNKDVTTIGSHHATEICFIALFYSLLYYGGYYQDRISIFVGSTLFFGILAVLFINHYMLKDRFGVFRFILLSYAFLSIWTVLGSPKPLVDTYDIFTEVTQKLLSGINPYTAVFTRTYPNIDNHFHYLPFSFIYISPFVFLFRDPRIGIICANIASAVLLKKIFDRNLLSSTLHIFIALFLFLPRSFFVLEHMYLDPIIFTFFLLFYYFFQMNKYSSAIVSLALFFSFKQNLFILLPFFILDSKIRTKIMKYTVMFLAPFLIIVVFYFLNSESFLKYTFLAMFGDIFFPSALKSTPTGMALSFQIFMRNMIPSIPTLSLYLLSGVLLLVSYIRIIVNSRDMLITKIVLTLFAMSYFMHLSFFNSYYFIALFYFFNWMVLESSTKQIKKPFIKAHEIHNERSEVSPKNVSG